MGDYPHMKKNKLSLGTLRSTSQQNSLEDLHDERHSYLPHIAKFPSSHRNSVNFSPVNRNSVLSSSQIQKEVDYFMNDKVVKQSNNAIQSVDIPLTIPEVNETTRHDWMDKYDHLKYVKILDFPSIPLSPNRIPLYSKKHDFGPNVGEKHVEISLYKNKFYVMIVTYTAGGKPIPELIELFTRQAKRIFKY